MAAHPSSNPEDQLTAFHPALQTWFHDIGTPTAAQQAAWPAIRAGGNVLLAAPTGTGKTLAAFLVAIDRLLQQGANLPDETTIVYISPLKALSNDIAVNLDAPLLGVREIDSSLPEIRAAIRHGDTTASERQRMRTHHPHILVTTPESLAILLTSDGGRAMLRTVRSVIVDEIHALAGDKRGSFLSLTLERLDHLVRGHCGDEVQRIGLSATQKPLEAIGHFLWGAQRTGTIIDGGHLRELDLGLETTASPLQAVCSHDHWAEILERIAELCQDHRTTLIFVNTRKLAERVTARLRELLGEDSNGEARVSCHHGSLAKERRHQAEQALKAGRLTALVATASLELGIDIGDIDLVVQIGSSRTIATFLQRAGRAGHGVGRIPKARLIPLTIDELEEHAALLRSVRAHELDAIIQPRQPLDILAQQIVACCACEPWSPEDLLNTLSKAWPYRHLDRTTFDRCIDLHAKGRYALVRRDDATGLLRGSKRARLTAITSGGAIPDQADLTVKEEPDGTTVGTLDEDFAMESSAGDVFQLGATSWQIVRVDGAHGEVRVRHMGDTPPTVPFWFGEAPARSRELSESVGGLRESCTDRQWLQNACGISSDAADQLWSYLDTSRKALGTLPSADHIVCERFFDQTGGMQLIIHAPLGARLMRAWGLALRKRFCRGFGFELEAVATEDALMLSLAPTTSFAVDEVFNYLSPASVRKVLTQACITGGQFETRWRWNVTRALKVERFSHGKRTPPHLVRLRATDALADAFPQVLACPENLAPGGLPIPEGHPLVDQTIADCLTELLDVDGLEEVLQAIKDGTIATTAVDTIEPSPLAGTVLAAKPYAFLDDTEFFERRSYAVSKPTGTVVEHPGELEPDVVRDIQAALWPTADSVQDVADILGWIGFLTAAEATKWQSWIQELQSAGRIVVEATGYRRTDVEADPVALLRGRIEAVGLVVDGDHPPHALLQLEQEGVLMQCRIAGDQRTWWAERTVLHRIHRTMRDQRRRAFEPVQAATFWRFLTRWQHLHPDTRLHGRDGLRTVVAQLAGCEAPALAWMRRILPARIKDFQPTLLDELTLAGDIAWGRLWQPAGAGSAPRKQAGGGLRFLPVSFVPRDQLDQWLPIAPAANEEALSGTATDVLAALRRVGACLHRELSQLRITPEHLEHALAELVAAGLVSADALGSLRWLALANSKRERSPGPRGRWHLFRRPPLVPLDDASEDPLVDDQQARFIALQLLHRTGIVFRRTWERERLPIRWRLIWRALRSLELEGQCIGGRFVAGFAGEQFALPAAIPQLRAHTGTNSEPVIVCAADPLNYTGLLTPDARVAVTSTDDIAIA